MRKKIITISFIIYIFALSIGSIIVKDKDFSDTENRNLKQFPEFSTKALFDGQFTSDFETYMSDQMIFKDAFVKLKTTTNLILNQTNINEVYFCDKDMMVQEFKEPYKQLDVNLGYINKFAIDNEGLEITWLIAPTAAHVYKDNLPKYASSYDQKEVLEYIRTNTTKEITVMDVFNELESNKDKYIYYKTDHHWNIKGAYIAYSKLCNTLGEEATEESEYEMVLGSDNFYGSLYSKAPTFRKIADEVFLYNNPSGEYTVEYLDDNTTSASLYNLQNLEIKDKYTTYLDGNHSIIKINSNSSNKESIIVVKDSYAHSLLPLLADNYSEIIVVDLRYYHSSVSELAKENDITKILFINNIEFIGTDNNFLWLY